MDTNTERINMYSTAGRDYASVITELRIIFVNEVYNIVLPIKKKQGELQWVKKSGGELNLR